MFHELVAVKLVKCVRKMSLFWEEWPVDLWEKINGGGNNSTSQSAALVPIKLNLGTISDNSLEIPPFLNLFEGLQSIKHFKNISTIPFLTIKGRMSTFQGKK